MCFVEPSKAVADSAVEVAESSCTLAITGDAKTLSSREVGPVYRTGADDRGVAVPEGVPDPNGGAAVPVGVANSTGGGTMLVGVSVSTVGVPPSWASSPPSERPQAKSINVIPASRMKLNALIIMVLTCIASDFVPCHG